MATSIIEDMVKPSLENESIKYRVARENCVITRLAGKSLGALNIAIVDLEVRGADMLQAVVLGMVNFPERMTTDALRVANDMTRKAIGKFYVAEGAISYALDWPVPDRTNRDEVRAMLSFAAFTADHLYPIAMSALWGGMAVDEAEAAQMKKDEDDGGGADSGIMSDDDIRRLLETD